MLYVEVRLWLEYYDVESDTVCSDFVVFQAQRSVSVGPATKRPRVDRSISVPAASASVLAMLEKHT